MRVEIFSNTNTANALFEYSLETPTNFGVSCCCCCCCCSGCCSCSSINF